MTERDKRVDLVVGLGEIGRPLSEILNQVYTTCERDIAPVPVTEPVQVLHICYPYEIGDFVGTTTSYVDEYKPDLTIIHSTVMPGTCRRISDRASCQIAYSPTRGKHTHMREDLLRYTKFVAGVEPGAAEAASQHLARAGFKVRTIGKCEGLEMAKLVETTYFGVLLAWAQEVERFAHSIEADYDEVMAMAEEVGYLPPVVFRPGYIGGHCVIPNTFLLEMVRPSPFLDLIRSSNEQKRDQYLREGKDLNERISPKPIESRNGHGH